MKLFQRINSLPFTFITFSCLGLAPIQYLQAQDSAFLDCARFTDSDARVACLEAALEAATAPAATPAVTTTNPPVMEAPAVQPAPVAVTAPVREEEPVATEQERIADFGQTQARISSNEEGDVLHDTVTAIEIRNNLLRITLSSGQVWQQEYPRTYNLRVGDSITIERGGFGGALRLSAERLSGFIRVGRVDGN